MESQTSDKGGSGMVLIFPLSSPSPLFCFSAPGLFSSVLFPSQSSPLLPLSLDLVFSSSFGPLLGLLLGYQGFGLMAWRSSDGGWLHWCGLRRVHYWVVRSLSKGLCEHPH